jgi:murein L,D-transpeptidase YafK
MFYLLFVSAFMASLLSAVSSFAGSEIYFTNLAGQVMVDSIAVHKADHEMLVFSRGVLLKKYIVQLGSHPVGPKQCFGDSKTPEGYYHISVMNAKSLFHKSLGISYPNTTDIERAIKLGRSPGGDIMIHGLPNGQEHVRRNRYRNDWTRGCIAVRNEEIDELFEHVKVGLPVVITQ